VDKPKAESRQLKQSIKKIEGINVDDAFVPSSFLGSYQETDFTSVCNYTH